MISRSIDICPLKIYIIALPIGSNDVILNE